MKSYVYVNVRANVILDKKCVKVNHLTCMHPFVLTFRMQSSEY